jgi:hypothetical protein
MDIYRSSTTMQMDAKYKAVEQSRCMTRVITALRSPLTKTVSSLCDPKPGSLTGNAVQFSVGRYAEVVQRTGKESVRSTGDIGKLHAQSRISAGFLQDSFRLNCCPVGVPFLQNEMYSHIFLCASAIENKWG